MNKARNASIAALLAAVFMVTGSGTPASALSIADIQAQIQSLLGQIAAFSAPASQWEASVTVGRRHRICLALYRNLSQGARGEDVVSLQEFLRAEGYLSANATGYFGPMTRDAVARWQASQGVSAVGAFGPVSRERIRIWCGAGGPMACTKEYVPVCGLKPIVCITTPCDPIQQTYGNRCLMQADGATFFHDGACVMPVVNNPPTISSFSGPTTLNVNQTGTWTIQASDPENGPLSYNVSWGDEYRAIPMMGYATETFVQTTTFTHVYSAAGTYTVSIVVRDSAGQEARTSTTVRIEGAPQYCTMEYAPVCGQPPEPACRYMPPYCMLPTPAPQTYGNRCMMNAVDATFLYEGECRNEPVACTVEAMQCPDGTWVGRTGPNCQFVCPGY